MAHLSHKVASLYPDAEAAHAAYDRLTAEGFSNEQLSLIESGDPQMAAKLEPERSMVKRHFVRNILLGGLIGALIGAVVPFLLALVGIEFAEGQPLRLLTWGAIYGATIGAIIGGLLGFKPREGAFATRVEDSSYRDAYAVLVHTPEKAQRDRAARILQGTHPKKILSY